LRTAPHGGGTGHQPELMCGSKCAGGRGDQVHRYRRRVARVGSAVDRSLVTPDSTGPLVRPAGAAPALWAYGVQFQSPEVARVTEVLPDQGRADQLAVLEAPGCSLLRENRLRPPVPADGVLLIAVNTTSSTAPDEIRCS
jgi:hypothetical protein